MSPQAARPPEESRTTCTPCRGTGKVISNLGDTSHEVTCPWCDGTGRFAAGRDAQEHPAETEQTRPADSSA